MKLRIGHLSTFYHTSIILMAKDTLTKNNIDAEWKLFGTGPSIVDAFSKKEIDIAYIGLPPALIGIERGINIICIAGGHIEGTVVAGRKGFKGFPEETKLKNILIQIKGKNIGVPGKGSIHDVILATCLEDFNLKNDIKVINFQWADMVLEAIVKGEVEIAFGTPALGAAIKKYADGRILYPPSKLWPDNPSYGILVDKNFLSDNSSIVERFLILHEEATIFLRDKPEEASKIIADYIGFIDRDLVLDALRISPGYCAKITGEYISSTMKFVGVLKRLEYINREISEKEIFNTTLIDKIHPERSHYRNSTL